MVNLFSGGNHISKIWKALEKERCISREKFKEALTQAKQEGRYVSEVLFEREPGSTDRILKVLAEAYAVPAVYLRELMISPLVLNLIPREVAEQHSIVIFKKIRGIIHVATTVPDNEQTIDFIRRTTGFEPRVFVTTPEDIRFALRKYQSELSTEFAQIIQQSTQEALALHETSEKMASFVPVIKMVNTIIERALSQGASDVHLESLSQKILIRFRIDGLLSKVVELPLEILPSLIARIRLLAGLKIDEHRQPQDGRFRYVYDGREIAIRVSILPALNGATAVLRLLDPEERQFGLGKLGLNHRDIVTMKTEIKKPHGLILVTGPTGSGKTTTLYTLLRMLNRPEVNICTVEDPVEYGIEGITQTQISLDGGITFATGLRSLLRQDPNVIMVGEIRDTETASLALNAAMTGHLVLSTLHTNSAFLAPQRLMEMGIPAYLAASVTNAIIGQRLVRRVCSNCTSLSSIMSKQYDQYRSIFDLEATYALLQSRELVSPDEPYESLRLAEGNGCQKCNETGFRGRIGIYEIMSVTEQVRATILQGSTPEQIEKEAVEAGALNMQQDGLLKVFRGKTTFHEVMRATQE